MLQLVKILLSSCKEKLQPWNTTYAKNQSLFETNARNFYTLFLDPRSKNPTMANGHPHIANIW